MLWNSVPAVEDIHRTTYKQLDSAFIMDLSASFCVAFMQSTRLTRKSEIALCTDFTQAYRRLDTLPIVNSC